MITLPVPAPFFGMYTSWLETRSFVSVLRTSPVISAATSGDTVGRSPCAAVCRSKCLLLKKTSAPPSAVSR